MAANTVQSTLSLPFAVPAAEVTDDRQHVAAPCLAVKEREMPASRDDQRGVKFRRDRSAQDVRGARLPRCCYVIPGSLDGQQRGVAQSLKIDTCALAGHCSHG